VRLYQTVCLFVCLSFRLSVCLSVCLPVRLPFCLSFCLPVCLFVYPVACPHGCLPLGCCNAQTVVSTARKTGRSTTNQTDRQAVLCLDSTLPEHHQVRLLISWTRTKKNPSHIFHSSTILFPFKRSFHEMQVDFDKFGGLETAATRRIWCFPCTTQTIGRMIKNTKNQKVENSTKWHCSRKWPYCQAQRWWRKNLLQTRPFQAQQQTKPQNWKRSSIHKSIMNVTE